MLTETAQLLFSANSDYELVEVTGIRACTDCESRWIRGETNLLALTLSSVCVGGSLYSLTQIHTVEMLLFDLV